MNLNSPLPQTGGLMYVRSSNQTLLAGFVTVKEWSLLTPEMSIAEYISVFEDVSVLYKILMNEPLLFVKPLKVILILS